MKNYDDLLTNSVKFNLMLNTVVRLESLKSQFVFQMCWHIYFFVIGLQIILKNVSSVLDIMFMMRLILFPR